MGFWDIRNFKKKEVTNREVISVFKRRFGDRDVEKKKTKFIKKIISVSKGHFLTIFFHYNMLDFRTNTCNTMNKK